MPKETKIKMTDDEFQKSIVEFGKSDKDTLEGRMNFARRGLHIFIRMSDWRLIAILNALSIMKLNHSSLQQEMQPVPCSLFRSLFTPPI
jgi:hypothetical protein